MGKLIIDNQPSLPDSQVLAYVKTVIEKGRISNYGTQYCYHSRWENGISVTAFKNEKSDRFVILNSNEES